jgi:cell wall-associated NlpC family hydrolase
MPKPEKRTIVVPFPQGVNEGDTSDAVYAVKRAWARRKGKGRLRKLENSALPVRRKWQKTFSEEFGAKSYTKLHHQKLAPWFDQKAISLLHVNQAIAARDKQIALELGWHNALYNRRFAVPYSQARPSQLVAANRVTRADCSGGVAGGAAWAHILPNVDWRYTNTWIQVTFGKAVRSINEAIPGDIILYGSPSHVALYLGNGIAWSFGSYPIKILPHNYRHDRHSIRRLVPLPD